MNGMPPNPPTLSGWKYRDEIPGLKPGAMFVDDVTQSEGRLTSNPIFYYVLEFSGPYYFKTLRNVVTRDEDNFTTVEWFDGLVDVKRFKLFTDTAATAEIIATMKKHMAEDANYYLKEFNARSDALLKLVG
jgi:hypothetical protein